MIEHIVLFKWKAGTSDDQIKAAHRGLAALVEQVPSIVELTIGSNFSSRSQGFQSGLCVRFEDRLGLEQYAAHPEHVRVVETLVKPIAESVLAVDYEWLGGKRAV